METQRWKRWAIVAGIVCAGVPLGDGVAVLAKSAPVASWFAREGVREYLRSHPIGKLQIGAGGNDLAGWLNTDIEPWQTEWYLDATKAFPVPSGSMRYVFSEHVIEHLTYEQGLGMLRESFRVLASGGRIRIVTPNILKLIDLFRDPKPPELQRYIEGKLAFHRWPSTPFPEVLILNRELHSFGHQFVYDPQALRDSLERAGFTAITEYRPGISNDPALAGIEIRPRSPMAFVNDYEAMAFEAVRP
jgi:hypothetical protein